MLSSNKVISIQVLALPVQPSSDKNYIRTLTYREPFVTVPVSASMTQAMTNLTYFDGLGDRLFRQIGIGQRDRFRVMFH